MTRIGTGLNSENGGFREGSREEIMMLNGGLEFTGM